MTVAQRTPPWLGALPAVLHTCCCCAWGAWLTRPNGASTLRFPAMHSPAPPPALVPAAALAVVVAACQPGAKIVDICEKGDSLMNECAGAIWTCCC